MALNYPSVPSILLEEKDFESYLPVFDPRRLAKPAVIKGTNFIFDIDGPRSAFASRFANWWQFDQKTRANTQDFVIGDGLDRRFFYGTPTGIWEINPTSLAPDLILPITTLKKHWPWTFAKVGNLYYFAQYKAGLWQYNEVTREWKEISNPYAEPIKGICAAYGRLICLGDALVFWSALDDGTDFAPSVTTGAGAQTLSILSTNAYRVDGVEDGFIVSTQEGWLKLEAVSASYVFRPYTLSDAIKTFSPNMTVKIPDVGLICLDAGGFHISWRVAGLFLSESLFTAHL